jgi:hypothetical protein
VFLIPSMRRRNARRYDLRDDRGNSSWLSPSIDFLSNDQKVVLAQRSSMVSSQQPGAFRCKEQQEIKSNKSQRLMLKQCLDDRNASIYFVDCNRRQPVTDEMIRENSTEFEILREFNERMNDFKQIIEVEVITQDNDQKHQQHLKCKKETLWGACIFIFTAIFMVSLVVPLVINNQRSQDTMSSQIESPFDLDECYAGNYLDHKRYLNFHAVIISYFPSMLDSIDTLGTSANVALCWLSQQDNQKLNPYVGDLAILAQRFVLATVYFHFLVRQNTTRKHGIFSSGNWLSLRDVCDWTQVGCHETGSSFRFVTSLDFSNQWIEALDIPSEIALLQNLTELILDPIEFQGTIPSELSSLTLLEVLRVTLQGSSSGSNVDKIMENWKRLETLSLDLGFPKLYQTLVS